MAKIKKILATLLVAATLVGVMAIPTSAATKDVPFPSHEEFAGYGVSGGLYLKNYAVTAAFDLTRKPGNAVVPITALQIAGDVYYYDSYGDEVSKFYHNKTESLSCRASASTDGITIRAVALYYINNTNNSPVYSLNTSS